MTFKGTSKAGTIVLEPGVEIPDGVEVQVRVKDPVGDPLGKMAALAIETGVPDLAANVDHYLYGHPKVRDDE